MQYQSGDYSTALVPPSHSGHAAKSYHVPAAAPYWDKRTTRGAAGRKDSLELTAALTQPQQAAGLAAGTGSSSGSEGLAKTLS